MVQKLRISVRKEDTFNFIKVAKFIKQPAVFNYAITTRSVSFPIKDLQNLRFLRFKPNIKLLVNDEKVRVTDEIIESKHFRINLYRTVLDKLIVLQDKRFDFQNSITVDGNSASFVHRLIFDRTHFGRRSLLRTLKIDCISTQVIKLASKRILVIGAEGNPNVNSVRNYFKNEI